VADTLELALIVTLHAPWPLHAPPHPLKKFPVPGFAVNDTIVPAGKLALHVVEQLLMPVGKLLTVPVPVTVTVKVNAVALNIAVTVVALLSVTTHGPVPLHPPPQLAKVDPMLGASLNVTCVPSPKFALHVVPQLIPAGELVTTPDPVPARLTVKATGTALNVAVTDVSVVKSTVHVPDPLQPPVHPANVDPVDGAAVSVTLVPLVKFALHVAPQLIPAGLLVTVPVPVPASATLNAGVTALKVAVTEAFWLNVTLHGPVPVHEPDHAAKTEFAPGVAVRVTVAPDEKFALHVDPQLIPPGLLVIDPAPLPATATVRFIEPGGGGDEGVAIPPPQAFHRRTQPREMAATNNL